MIKERELQVLKELRSNSRKHFTRMSREINIPVTTIFDYYTKLKKAVIKKHVSLLNFEALDYKFTAFYAITCFDREKIVKFLRKDSCINQLFLIGDERILFEAIFREYGERLRLISLLDEFSIKDFQEYPVFKELERECFVPSV